MKLFVLNKEITNQKIYLNILASSRSELVSLIGSFWFSINGINYNANDVFAEGDKSNAIAGAIVGGLIGAVTGSFGILIGSSIGGALGNEKDKEESQRVDYFNNSVWR